MTRMWLVDTSILCKNHLLGEHKEIHQLVGSLRKRTKLDGFVRNNLIEIRSIKRRHDELVQEMDKRGYKHHSELKDYCTDHLAPAVVEYRINVESSLQDLLNRCHRCGHGG